nr:MAG TPA: hypothetical protein [Caudoviricetes sp.]
MLFLLYLLLVELYALLVVLLKYYLLLFLLLYELKLQIHQNQFLLL